MGEQTAMLSDEDLERFAGEWVVISENKVVAHSGKLTDLDDAINNCMKTPSVVKIPKEDTLIF